MSSYHHYSSKSFVVFTHYPFANRFDLVEIQFQDGFIRQLMDCDLQYRFYSFEERLKTCNYLLGCQDELQAFRSWAIDRWHRIPYELMTDHLSPGLI